MARTLVTSWRKIVAGAWWPGPGGGLGRLPGHHLMGDGSAKLLPHQKCTLPAGAKPGLSAAGRAPAAVFHTPTDATRSWPGAKLMGPRWELGQASEGGAGRGEAGGSTPGLGALLCLREDDADPGQGPGAFSAGLARVSGCAP